MKSKIGDVQSSAQAGGRMAQAALRCFPVFFGVKYLGVSEWAQTSMERGGIQ